MNASKAHSGACRDRPRVRGHRASHRGVPGTECAGTTFRLRGTIHTMALPGNPRGRTIRCICTSSEGGRRRAIGVVAVPQSALARPRRWRDAGMPKAAQKAGASGSHGVGGEMGCNELWERASSLSVGWGWPHLQSLGSGEVASTKSINPPVTRTPLSNAMLR